MARLIERAAFHDDRIALTLRRSELIAALGCVSKEAPAQDVGEGLDNRPPLILDIPLILSRRGRSARLVLNDAGAGNAKVNAPLVRLIATAHRRFAALAAGEAPSTGELAKREATDPSELSRTIQLASLAPDIVEKILLAQQPVDLTATRLKKLRDLPLGWPNSANCSVFRPDRPHRADPSSRTSGSRKWPTETDRRIAVENAAGCVSPPRGRNITVAKLQK